MEQNKGLVSVIIPAYNAEKYIEECLNSITSQSYTRLEIIVINDGSRDSTEDIVARLAKADDRIKLHSQENGGVSAARNTALNYATGEFIIYVDADDTVPEGAFEKMIGAMADDIDLLICSHNEIRLNAKPRYEKPNEFNGIDDINSRFREFDRVIWWPWAKVLRRSVISDNNLRYDTSITFGEDHIFNLNFAKHIKGRVVVCDIIAYNYYFLRGGLTSHYYPNMNDLQKLVYTKIAEYFGGQDKIPRKYHSLYAGSYFKGLVEYYIAWNNLKDAEDKIKETYEVSFNDILDDEIIREYFTSKQAELLIKGDYKGFLRDYIKANPKATIWRKVRRSVRKVIEGIITK